MSNTAQPTTAHLASRQAGRLVGFVDRRVTTSRWMKRNARKSVADHWSFWLGYIALFSLVVILLSGVFLTVYFEPSMAPVTYDGAYAPLHGVIVSEAYASTLDLSFEVRGGLLMRQVHYWATHVFIASMALHLLRVFFTGAFRGRRKLNWLIGLALLVLGIIGGYTRHALPDDLLSGAGLRVVEGGILAIPVVGTYLSSFIFGGEYPGDDIISRLNLVHVFVIPALIVALLVVHLILVRRQRRAGRRDASSANRDGMAAGRDAGWRVVRTPFSVHIARATGLMLIVSGFILLMAATLQINPVWLRGPYDPSQVSAGSQPDWYMGFLDGAMRLMPPWAFDVFGHEVAVPVLVPVIVLPGIILGALAVYPWVEERITGVESGQHLLDRPRSMPTRTGLGVGFVVFYLVLWMAGGNDILATVLDVPVNWVTRFMQVSVVLMPPLAYSITKRICLGLLRRERDKLRHGHETGVTVVSPDGAFAAVHRPLSRRDVDVLTSRARLVPLEPDPEVDENGIPAPRQRWSRLRVRLSRMYFGDVIDDAAAPASDGTAGDHELQHASTGSVGAGVKEETQR